MAQAHGQRYGAFCHSDITNALERQPRRGAHAARDRVLDWLFVAAPRVAVDGQRTRRSSLSLQPVDRQLHDGCSCPSGEVDDTLTSGTKGSGIDVVGVCKHPGFFDGDDHAITACEFTVSNGATCNGTYRWTQAHDSDNNHAATFWWKTRSVRSAGPELLGTLPTG